MSKNFIISTTDDIEGCPIKKYIDVINVNTVVGTNVFSDIAASFTDFFGGKSTSYKNKLESMFNDVKEKLKQKAINIGANAIVGLRMDFDEISGKDKSMFMVSASGTACIIDFKQSNYTENKELTHVDQQALENEINRRQVILDVTNNKTSINEWFEFLMENPQVELIDSLLDIYIYYWNLKNETTLFNIARVLSVLPKEALLPKVYEKYIEYNNAIRKLIRDCYLFDPKYILPLFDTNVDAAINIIDTKSESYSREDIDLMLKIKSKIEILPDTGKIEIVKSGIIGKEQKKFICQNGHKNDPDFEFCERCGLNIKGLTQVKVNKINQFYKYINIIQYLINH